MCLAEAIPGVVSALGRLDPNSVSEKLETITPEGRKLDQSKPLPDQNVQAGAFLTPEPVGRSARDLRHDDFIGAVDFGIDQDSKEWTPADSLQLSSHAAATLILVAALLLTLGSEHGYLSATIGIIGTFFVVAASVVIIRIPSVAEAVSLSATAPLLMVSAGLNLVGGSWRPVTWLVGGVGILVAATSALVLSSCIRAIMVALLVVGTTMVLNGVIGASTAIPLGKTASSTLALFLITPLSAPWLTLAQIPVKVTDLTSIVPIGIYEIHEKASALQVLVVITKTGVSVSLGFLAPMLFNSPETIILFGCSGAVLMLTTRPLRSHLGVLIGVITGMLLILGAIFGAARSCLAMVPSIVIAALTVVACLLAVSVANARTRPWLTRAANALGTIVLLMTLPLAIMMWGVI